MKKTIAMSVQNMSNPFISSLSDAFPFMGGIGGCMLGVYCMYSLTTYISPEQPVDIFGNPDNGEPGTLGPLQVSPDLVHVSATQSKMLAYSINMMIGAVVGLVAGTEAGERCRIVINAHIQNIHQD